VGLLEKLIELALRAGLNDTEADEVVQETAIAISRHLPEFRYDPKVCRFKTWLLNQAV
jgi:DNA-directed RNA polymerase specialized sigma24 family protein